MQCKKCGSLIPDQATFCSYCGLAQYAEQQAYYSPAKRPVKKKSRFLRRFLIFIGILSAIVLAVYFLVPGLLRPYDLGVTASTKAYKSALNKLNLTRDKSPSDGTREDYEISYGSPQAVKTSLDSEEITSFLSVNRPPYYALKNVQVRINDDDTIEASATVDTSFVFDEILNGKYNNEDAKTALPMVGLLPKKVNVYFKIEGSIENNRIDSLSIDNVSVLGIPIPESLVDSEEATSFIVDSLNSYMSGVFERSGASYDSVRISDGQLDFDGRLPSSIERLAAE